MAAIHIYFFPDCRVLDLPSDLNWFFEVSQPRLFSMMGPQPAPSFQEPATIPPFLNLASLFLRLPHQLTMLNGRWREQTFSQTFQVYLQNFLVLSFPIPPTRPYSMTYTSRTTTITLQFFADLLSCFRSSSIITYCISYS
jgi:hypothetical protein